MSNSGLVLIKNKGMLVPEGLVKKIIPAFPNFMGTVMQVGPDLNPAAYDDVPSVDQFMSAQEASKDQTVIFYFGKTAQNTKFTDESVQPFELLADADGKCVLAAACEGEFFTFNKPESTHSDEYHMNEEFLKPTMAELLDAANGDLDALMAKIKEPLKQKQLLMAMVNRGIIVLMSADGEIIKIEKGNDGMRMEELWGYVSNCLGYVEGSSKDVAPEVKKPGVVRRVIAAVTPAAKTTIASENTKPADTALADAMKTAKDEHPVPAPDFFALKEQAGKIYIQCPQNITTKGERRDWHRMWTVLLPNGEPPSKYKDHPGPWCEANQNFLDVRSKKISDWKTLPLPQVHMSVTPIITPKTKSALTQLINSGAVQAIITKAKVLNPDELKNRSVASFSAQQGIEFSDTLQWDREIKLKIIEKCIAEKDLMPIILAWEEAQNECMALMVGATAPAADTNDKTEKKEIVLDPLKTEKKEVVAAPAVHVAPVAPPAGNFGTGGRRVVRKVA